LTKNLFNDKINATESSRNLFTYTDGSIKFTQFKMNL